MSENTTKVVRSSSRLAAQKMTMPILNFPLEIRMRIFELFFATARLTQEEGPLPLKELPLKGPYSIRVRYNTPRSKHAVRRENHPRAYDWFGSEAMTRLLRVNKQINEEATNVLYAMFTFEFINFPLETPDPCAVLPRLAAKQRQLIRSVRLAVVVHPTIGATQLSELQGLSELLPNLRSVDFLPFITTWGDMVCSPPDIGWPEQVLRLFQCVQSAQLWTVEHCDPPERPPPTGRSKYDHCWYTLMEPESRIELDQKLYQRNSAGSHSSS